jgi:hypothetical protein
MEKLEQVLAQMADSIRSDSNWLIENHIRQGREHDQRLAQAEQLLRQLLELVIEQRARFGGYRRDQVSEQPPPEQIRGPRERALAEMRQRTKESANERATGT